MNRSARPTRWLLALALVALVGVDARASACPNRLLDLPCDLLARHGGVLAVDRGVVLELVVRPSGVRAHLVDRDGERLDAREVRGRISITVRGPDGSVRARSAVLAPELDDEGQPKSVLVARWAFGAFRAGERIELRTSLHGLGADGQRSRSFSTTIAVGVPRRSCCCKR